MMKVIHSDEAPAAIGPYSQAVRAGDFLYISGQIGIDPKTGEMAGAAVADQAEQAAKNVEAILAAAGLSMEKVVKTTCFLMDMKDFAAFNAVYETHFISRPARSCVAVAGLPAGALCEIETIALAD